MEPLVQRGFLLVLCNLNHPSLHSTLLPSAAQRAVLLVGSERGAGRRSLSTSMYAHIICRRPSPDTSSSSNYKSPQFLGSCNYGPNVPLDGCPMFVNVTRPTASVCVFR